MADVDPSISHVARCRTWPRAILASGAVVPILVRSPANQVKHHRRHARAPAPVNSGTTPRSPQPHDSTDWLSNFKRLVGPIRESLCNKCAAFEDHRDRGNCRRESNQPAARRRMRRSHAMRLGSRNRFSQSEWRNWIARPHRNGRAGWSDGNARRQDRCGAAGDDVRSADAVPPRIRYEPEIEPLSHSSLDANRLEKTDCDRLTVFTKRTRDRRWRRRVAPRRVAACLIE
jgi:hypothetical protein